MTDSLLQIFFDGEPEALEAAGHAYEKAIVLIGGDSAACDHREDLLNQIVELARNGELDAGRLCEHAYEASMGLDAAMVTFTGL